MKVPFLISSVFLGSVLFSGCSDETDDPVETDTELSDVGIEIPDGNTTENDVIEDSNSVTNDPDVEDDVTDENSIFCDGSTTVLYDPSGSSAIELWPDDLLRIEDPLTLVGYRLELNEETAFWSRRVKTLMRDTVDNLWRLSGFGTNSAVLVRFDSPVSLPELDAEESLNYDGIQLLDLSTSPPTRLAYQAHLGNDDQDLFVQPLLPMSPNTVHSLIVTNSFVDKEGNCIAPAPLQASLLLGEAPSEMFEELSERIPEAIDAADLLPEEISAITVFTTHNDIINIIAARDAALEEPLQWEQRGTCLERENHRECELTVMVGDYREHHRFISAISPTPWRARVLATLPNNFEAPFPVIFYGHGLGGDRFQIQFFAEAMADLGIAMVGSDALVHGDHPTANLAGNNPEAEFLGMDIEGGIFDAFALGSNIGQTELDRLQILETMLRDPDLDGDGNPDIDMNQLSYWGISLGAMMGPELLALNDDFQASVLTIGGGHLSTFVTSQPSIEEYRELLGMLAGSEEAFDRLLVVAQSAADVGDPATWAPFVLRDRLDEGSIPSILFPVATEDEVVPPPTGRALARALEIDHMTPVVDPVATLDVINAPVLGNEANGSVTAAYFQLDRVGVTDPQPATHMIVPGSEEALLQTFHFFETWLDGVPEIIDPYQVLGTPHLEE